MKTIVIVGGGPAGLFAAINSAGDNTRVILVEKNDLPGKKLLISGSGQCNLTHSGKITDFFHRYHENWRFLKPALLSFTNTDLIDFFEKRGLELTVTDKGKVFPLTMKADDVLRVLLNECKLANIRLILSTRVNKICTIPGGLAVKTDRGDFAGDSVILTTGGKSYPWTGSTGDGFSFAEKLGHTIVEPVPALTPLHVKDHPFGKISGVSLRGITLSLWRCGKKLAEVSGDILFTHNGISGPGVLHISRHAEKGDTVKINFTDHADRGRFDATLARELSNGGKLLVKTVLEFLDLPRSLLEKLVSLAGIEPETRGSELKKTHRKLLAECLTEFPLEIERVGDFKVAMVTRGGISTREVKPSTMESRIVPGLFFAGEILDIDGETGGYNLQAAFSTAYVAGGCAKLPVQYRRSS